MKNITAITVQQKNKNRSNVYVDGEYYCSLSNVTVIAEKLKVGPVDDEEFERILLTDGESAAFELALGYVCKYARSKKQTLDYLMKKGYAYPVAFKAVEKLVSYGYLSDDDFAAAFVEQNKSSKGKLLLKRQLRQKGIDEKCADKAINEQFGDETEPAKRLAEKYMRGKEPVFENFGKCYRYLLSKGFSYDAASSVIDFLKKGNDDF